LEPVVFVVAVCCFRRATTTTTTATTTAISDSSSSGSNNNTNNDNNSHNSTSTIASAGLPTYDGHPAGILQLTWQRLLSGLLQFCVGLRRHKCSQTKHVRRTGSIVTPTTTATATAFVTTIGPLLTSQLAMRCQTTLKQQNHNINNNNLHTTTARTTSATKKNFEGSCCGDLFLHHCLMIASMALGYYVSKKPLTAVTESAAKKEI
jgi:hypothetical protein